MHLFGQDIHAFPGLLLIVSAGVMLYIASRAAADALAGLAALSPGRMAIGHWIPIAAVGLLAMIVDRSDVAIGVVFASSVACLSLAAGTVAFLAPPGESTPAPVWARRAWPMILPTAMLIFLAGFRGELTLTHAGILLIEGVVVLLLWIDSESALSGGDDRVPIASRVRARVRISPLRVLQLLLAVGLSAIGAWAAVHGAARGSGATRTIYTDVNVASAGLLAATILSPLLILPMLGGGVELAHRGQGWVAITSQVGVVLLNLCLLLPVVVVEGHYHPLRTAVQWAQAELRGEPYFPAAVVTPTPTTPSATTTRASATTSPSIEDDEAEPTAVKAVPLPLAVWRVDVVALIALGLFLLPVAVGRWPLSKGQGLGLIAAYIAYLLLAMMLGVRLI
jgi:hypothetical protein